MLRARVRGPEPYSFLREQGIGVLLRRTSPTALVNWAEGGTPHYINYGVHCLPEIMHTIPKMCQRCMA